MQTPAGWVLNRDSGILALVLALLGICLSRATPTGERAGAIFRDAPPARAEIGVLDLYLPVARALTRTRETASTRYPEPTQKITLAGGLNAWASLSTLFCCRWLIVLGACHSSTLAGHNALGAYKPRDSLPSLLVVLEDFVYYLLHISPALTGHHLLLFFTDSTFSSLIYFHLFYIGGHCHTVYIHSPVLSPPPIYLLPAY